MSRWIVVAEHTAEHDPAIRHSSYYGPYLTLSGASDRADALWDLYRKRAFRIDGYICRTTVTSSEVQP